MEHEIYRGIQDEKQCIGRAGVKAAESRNRKKRVQNIIMMAKAGGEPMQSAFSYSELEKLLETHGFLIYELLTPDDIQRDVIDRAGADLNAFEHVNYCLAVRKK